MNKSLIYTFIICAVFLRLATVEGAGVDADSRLLSRADASKVALVASTFNDNFADATLLSVRYDSEATAISGARVFGVTRPAQQDRRPALGVAKFRDSNASPAPIVNASTATANDSETTESETNEATADAEGEPQIDTTAQQAADAKEEEKARALSEGSEGNDDAPDAEVQITEGEITDEDRAAAEKAQPKTEQEKTAQTPSLKSYRNPLAEKAIQEMTNDMLDNLKSRGGAELYQRWRAYNASIRRRTNSLQTGNELNSRCRLKWYERLYQDPLSSVPEVERVSHALGQAFMGSMEDVVSGVRLGRSLTDVPLRQERFAIKKADSPDVALENLKAALVEAAACHARAIAPMSPRDREAVKAEAHQIFCAQVVSGHTVESRGRAQYLIDALERMSKSELYNAGEAILACLGEENLAQLAQLDFNSVGQKVQINNDQTVVCVKTQAGDILIGDKTRTIWELDKYPNACCVIDLGGNDVYREGSCVLNRPILVVIDLGGDNDEYVGSSAAIQGGAILGVSVWYDQGGKDTYVAKDVCQGSAIGGFGALINGGGDDKYLGFLRCQGTSISGFGLLLDQSGCDDYRGALFAQGVGGPGGFAACVDTTGNDHYYVGGYYFDSYPEHPGYDGWGQGVGAGIRRVACGGVGCLLDGAGDDAYEFDYFGHGGGYWMGIGFARDFDGNDIRYAATSTMYDGTARRERRWQRFGCGWGCHYACGYLFDDRGSDVYGGTIMGTGMGWDLGAGFLVDIEGNDRFEATGGLTQGSGGEGSIGVLMNYRGDDVYLGNYQGYAATSISYHSPTNCGANFSFVIDHGGKDQYGGYDNYRRPLQNNAITQRGGATGLVIDRPAPNEAKESSAATIDAKAPVVTANGMPNTPKKITTMANDPPLYDTTPHATSNGMNAFNSSSTPEASPGFGGGRPFGGFGIFGGRML